MDSPSNAPNVGTANPAGISSGYGVVQSIELVKQGDDGIAGSGIGLGTIAGAVVGGVVGNQVGSGRGNTAATVIGAAGGAYIGHELENRQQQKPDAHKVTIRLEDGSYQAVTQSTNAGLRVGDRVRMENGVLQRY
jgi:outer membrane lipoprotein SlyB